MSRNRRIFEDIIRNIMVFSVFISPVTFFTYTVTYNVGTAWLCLLLLPLFLLFYIIRQTANTVWIFAPLHILFLLPPFLFLRVNIMLFVIFIAFALACVVHSFDVKYRGEHATNGQLFFFGSLINVAKIVISARIGLDTLAEMSVVLVLVLAAGYLILMNMKSLDESLATFSSRANMDNRTVLRFNNFLLAGYVLLLMGITSSVLLFFGNDGIKTINNVLSSIGNFFKLLLFVIFRWLLSLINPSAIENASPETAEQPGAVEAILQSIELRGTPSDFSRFIDSVIRIVGTLLIIAIVCVFIYTLLTRIYKNFKPAENNDIEEKLEPKTLIRRAMRKKAERDFGNGEAKKVRKRYYKAVKRQKELTPKNTDTAQDILQKSNVDITALTREYEHARYNK